jgi:hypothetical protein
MGSLASGFMLTEPELVSFMLTEPELVAAPLAATVR